MGQKHSIARHAALGFLLSTVGHCLMLASGSAAAMAANPAVVIPTAPLVTPANALTYYGNPTSPTPPTTRDPLVAEAARSLRYDVDTIYAFVRDNVRLTPVFGLQKGARGVVLDGYGTAFDQAHFMVDTLREADAVAAKGYNPVYKMGTITLSAAEFSAWTGISDAAIASKFLANGGIPATVSGSGASFTISMLHIWVQVTINGADYLFDPSFKPSTRVAGLSWQSQTGYNQATLLAAGGGATATTVNGFNIANFRSKLAEYRASLETYIGANAAGKRAQAVVGDDVITANMTAEDRQTVLTYVTSTERSWSGQIPNIFRTSFTVKLNGSAYNTYYADVDGGEILGFSYSYSGGQFTAGSQLPSPVVASSFLDPCDQYLSNRATASKAAVASIDINHPYAANSGSYADRTISRQIVSQVCTSGRFFVSNDWGYTGNGVNERMAPVAAQIRSDPTRTTDFTFGPTIANIASQYSSFLDLASKAQSSVFQVHDLIGIHALDNVSFNINPPNSASLSTSPSMSFEAAVSAFGKSGMTSADITAAYIAGLGLSYAEGAVPRQETDSVYDMAALSLVTQQDARATTPGTYTTYLANPSASPTWSSVKGSLVDYPDGSTVAANSYVSEGYSLLIPQRGALRQPPITVPIRNSGNVRIGTMLEGVGPGSTSREITRSAFLAWRPSSGVGSAPDRIALVLYDQRRGSLLKAGVGVPIETGVAASPVRKPDVPKVESRDFIRTALSVDGRTGALSYAPAPDLTDGAGDFPRSLSLQRVYSQRDLTNYGFGLGWKSNWHQVATLSNDGQLALGRGGAQAVASALVAIQAIGDLTTTQDAQHLYAALQTASWLTDQTINNSIVVSRGLDPDHAFYAQASGNYVSSKSDGSTLSVTGNPTVGIINRRLYYGLNLQYTDRDGSSRYYPVNTPDATTDLSSPSIASALTRKNIYLSEWVFPNGISIKTAYVSHLSTPTVVHLYKATNNLGAAIYEDDYDYGAWGSFPYCDVPGGEVQFGPARAAKLSYRTATAEALFNMDAQVRWVLNGDPDSARCKPGTLTPDMTPYERISYLRNAVDPVNETWRVDYANVGGMFGTTPGLSRIYKPSNTTSPDITVAFGSDGNVRSFTNLRGNSWNYYSTPFRSESVSPLQAATPGRGIVTYYDQYGQATRSVDPLLRQTRTSYDDWGRPSEVTQPEGNSVVTAYDVRGNVITQTQKPKPNTGLAELVITTAYAEDVAVSNCANIIICNKPIYTIDPRGFRSDYSWNSATGMPLSVRQGWNSTGTACQIQTGGGCPSVTFTYGSGLTGFDPSEGANSGPIYLPQTQVEAAESGTTTTTYGYTLKTFTSTYAPLSGHNVRKLVPTQVTVDSGGLNLVTCFDYDDAGNIISDRSPRGGGTCP